MLTVFLSKCRYAYAKKAGARGVGMWHASALNYSDIGSDADYLKFWTDLKVFSH
jgi:hypothetical protein